MTTAANHQASLEELAHSLAETLHISPPRGADELNGRALDEGCDWEKECQDMDQMFEEQARLQLEGNACNDQSFEFATETATPGLTLSCS